MSVILPVAQRGEDILRLKAARVADAEFNSDWLMQLASTMIATMLERSGVGIAAPRNNCLQWFVKVTMRRRADTGDISSL